MKERIFSDPIWMEIFHLQNGKVLPMRWAPSAPVVMLLPMQPGHGFFESGFWMPLGMAPLTSKTYVGRRGWATRNKRLGWVHCQDLSSNDVVLWGVLNMRLEDVLSIHRKIGLDQQEPMHWSWSKWSWEKIRLKNRCSRHSNPNYTP